MEVKPDAAEKPGVSNRRISMNLKRKYLIWSVCMAGLILVCSLIALCMGQFRIEPSVVLKELFTLGKAEGVKDNIRTTLFNIRIPRIGMSLVAGAGLAASGAAV